MNTSWLRLILAVGLLLHVGTMPGRAQSPAPTPAASPSPSASPSPTPKSARTRIDVMKEAESPISTIVTSVQWNAYVDFDSKTPGAVTMVVVHPQKFDGWHLVHRAAVGVPYVPIESVTRRTGAVPSAPEVGIGDLNYTPYFTPDLPGNFILGLGPAVTLPTATGRLLGTGKVLAGPSVVCMYKGRNAIIGVLATQQWSVAGDPTRADVSAATIQPLFYYNFPDKSYIVSTPRISVNWNARQAPRWSLPIGGGVGKFIKIGDQHANVSVQAFYHLERPLGALWSMNLQFQLLFPTARPGGSE